MGAEVTEVSVWVTGSMHLLETAPIG